MCDDSESGMHMHYEYEDMLTDDQEATEPDPDERDLELVAFVRNCPLLWNNTRKEFKNAEDKSMKWDTNGAALTIPMSGKLSLKCDYISCISILEH